MKELYFVLVFFLVARFLKPDKYFNNLKFIHEFYRLWVWHISESWQIIWKNMIVGWGNLTYWSPAGVFKKDKSITEKRLRSVFLWKPGI